MQIPNDQRLMQFERLYFLLVCDSGISLDSSQVFRSKSFVRKGPFLFSLSLSTTVFCSLWFEFSAWLSFALAIFWHVWYIFRMVTYLSVLFVHCNPLQQNSFCGFSIKCKLWMDGWMFCCSLTSNSVFALGDARFFFCFVFVMKFILVSSLWYLPHIFGMPFIIPLLHASLLFPKNSPNSFPDFRHPPVITMLQHTYFSDA